MLTQNNARNYLFSTIVIYFGSIMNQMKAIIAVFVGAVSFGILSTFVKKAYAAGFTLGEVTGVQALLGMLILWTLFIFQKKKSKQHTRSSKKWKIIVAGVSTGMVSVLYYKCVALVPASIAIVLLMQFIWISALINWILYQQKPSKKQSYGIAGILIATLFATGILQQNIQQLDLIGIGYGLLAATAYAVFIIVNGKVGNDYPPAEKSALMISGASIFIFITLQPFHLITLEIDHSIFSYGLLLAVFGTVLPPFLFAYGMPRIGVSLGSILSAVELPVAVSMSYFVLQESVSTLQWLGVGSILAIVIWTNWNRSNN